MTDEVSGGMPDRLSINPTSPYFNGELLARGVGIRFNGAEKTNVEEYCVSEGWIRVAAGKGEGPPRQSSDDQTARSGRTLHQDGVGLVDGTRDRPRICRRVRR